MSITSLCGKYRIEKSLETSISRDYGALSGYHPRGLREAQLRGDKEERSERADVLLQSKTEQSELCSDVERVMGIEPT